jgi:hypothetical protein
MIFVERATPKDVRGGGSKIVPETVVGLLQAT